jgi:glycosyltransferase involved in cell wall biosynthesis
MNPEISIITTVHNEQKFIEKCLKSVIGQTFENFELLVLDDASDDETLDIIKEYEKKDKRIKVYKNEIKVGPARAANFLLNLSKERNYFARIDGDDIWLNFKLERQLSFLKEQEADFVCSNVDYIDQEDNYQHTHITPNGKELNWSLNFLNHIRHSTVIWRGNFFYDENFYYSLDYELWARARKNHKIESLPEVTTLYRNHPSSITNTQRDEQLRLADIISKREMEFYLKKELSMQEVNKLQNLFRTNQEAMDEDFQKLKSIFL